VDRSHPPVFIYFISINGYFCVAMSQQQSDASGVVNRMTIVVIVVYFEKVL